MAFVEVLGIPFAIYGIYKWRRGVEKITRTDNVMVFSAIISVIVIFFILHEEMFEVVLSEMFLIADLLLIRKKIIGWYISAFANIALMYVLFDDGNYIFATFQVVSIGIVIKKIFS